MLRLIGSSSQPVYLIDSEFVPVFVDKNQLNDREIAGTIDRHSTSSGELYLALEGVRSSFEGTLIEIGYKTKDDFLVIGIEGLYGVKKASLSGERKGIDLTIRLEEQCQAVWKDLYDKKNTLTFVLKTNPPTEDDPISVDYLKLYCKEFSPRPLR